MLQTVVEVLNRCRVSGWLVGGSVRDRELGRYSPDLDLVVAGDARRVAGNIARRLGVPWFALSERHGAYRVLGREGRVDVASLRGGDLLADLSARDFTINAMALSLPDQELIDPFHGLEHLRDRSLVAVSERIFVDDPLRLMRAARFCHVLGFRLTQDLAESVRFHAPLLKQVAPERVTAELVLTLAVGRTADAVRLWRDLGLLDVFLPLAAKSLGKEQETAWLEKLDDLLLQPAAWFPHQADLLSHRLSIPVSNMVPRPVAVRLAGLLLATGPSGAETTTWELRLSRHMARLLRTAAALVGVDARIDALTRGGPREEVCFLWEAHPWEPEILLLLAARTADFTGSVARLAAPVLRLMSLWEKRTKYGVPKAPIDGEVILRELGLRSGPAVGIALREVRLAWEAGLVTTREQGLQVAREALAKTEAAESQV